MSCAELLRKPPLPVDIPPAIDEGGRGCGAAEPEEGRMSEANHVDGVIDEDSALEEELLAADGKVEAKEANCGRCRVPGRGSENCPRRRVGRRVR